MRRRRHSSPRPLPPAPACFRWSRWVSRLGTRFPGLAILKMRSRGCRSPRQRGDLGAERGRQRARCHSRYYRGGAGILARRDQSLGTCGSDLGSSRTTFEQTIVMTLAEVGTRAPRVRSPHPTRPTSPRARLDADAAGIAASSAVVATSNVRQDVGVQAAAEAARAVASDPRLDAVALAAHRPETRWSREHRACPSSGRASRC